MSDIETIKSRIRKLMTVAGDGVATDGEIDNAMRLAAKLLDQHHLAESEIGTHQDAEDLTMGQAFATSRSERFSTWETTLGCAVAKLFGCVQFFVSGDTAPIRVNGIAEVKNGEVRRGRKVCFYGPVVESREAAELFEEWSRAISAMGVARWGGCFRGDGAMYCHGFTSALNKKARQINQERGAIEAKPLPGPASSTAITLLDRYSQIAKRASTYLKDECHIHLRAGGARAGYSGSDEAFREGKEHGGKAEFGRTEKRKMIE